jgi:hypothetical protein
VTVLCGVSTTTIAEAATVGSGSTVDVVAPGALQATSILSAVNKPARSGGISCLKVNRERRSVADMIPVSF